MQINILGIVSRLFPISQEVVIFLQKHQKENFMAGRLGGNAILSCNTLILMKYWCPGAESTSQYSCGFQRFWWLHPTTHPTKSRFYPPFHAFAGAVLYMTPGAHSARYYHDGCLINTSKPIFKKNLKKNLVMTFLWGEKAIPCLIAVSLPDAAHWGLSAAYQWVQSCPLIITVANPILKN